MIVDFATRDMTDDVDGGVYPAEEVLSVAAAVGARRGLPAEWLSDAAKIYIPVFKQPDWRPVRKVGTLEIFSADARAMLAMKIRASRGRRDEADLAFLLHECRITTEENAIALYEEFFPEDPLPERARPMIRFALHERL